MMRMTKINKRVYLLESVSDRVCAVPYEVNNFCYVQIVRI